jgi:hypothetical protein
MALAARMRSSTWAWGRWRASNTTGSGSGWFVMNTWKRWPWASVKPIWWAPRARGRRAGAGWSTLERRPWWRWPAAVPAPVWWCATGGGGEGEEPGTAQGPQPSRGCSFLSWRRSPRWSHPLPSTSNEDNAPGPATGWPASGAYPAAWSTGPQRSPAVRCGHFNLLVELGKRSGPGAPSRRDLRSHGRDQVDRLPWRRQATTVDRRGRRKPP